MQIIDLDKDNVKINIDAITLGNFDGLHLAHQKLINKCVSLGKSGVIIFKSHTSEVLEYANFKNILTTDDKINILKRMNVDYCLIKSFDKAFLSLKPVEFLTYVKEHTNFKNLVVGKDFKFGINASGNVSTLEDFQKVFNYKLYTIDDQFIKNVPIRSTTIRKFLMSGDVENANSMLYRPFSIKGVVVDGKHRGRNLGYPTANLECKQYIIPAAGVYYTNVIYDNKLYKGITSVGENLTYDEHDVKIETHILDFKGDLYGKILTLVFIKKIRDNVKFNSEIELINKLKSDYNFAKNQDLDLQLQDYMII